MQTSRFTTVLVATRGERLVLGRSRFELAGGDIGPSQTESLVVSEFDEQGLAVATVIFDPEDIEAAYAELDKRYVAGEAAA